MEAINLLDKFQQFNDHWSPKVIGELNGQHVKLAKLKGEFCWHDHANEDELFFVVKGTLKIQFRDRDVLLQPGELCIVPRGVEHNPVAEEEVWIMLFEPAQIKHTGEVEHELTVKHYDRL